MLHSRRYLRRSIYQLRAPPAIAFCLCLGTANVLERAERWLKGRVIRIPFMVYENGKKGIGAFVDRMGCPAGRLLLPLVWKQDLACGGTRCIRQGPGHEQFVSPHGEWVGLSLALLAVWVRSRRHGILRRTQAPARREG